MNANEILDIADKAWIAYDYVDERTDTQVKFTDLGSTLQISFRPTESFEDIIQDLKFYPSKWRYGLRAHYGFKQCWEGVREEVIRRATGKDRVEFFGHSLGGAISILGAVDFNKLGINSAAFVTGAPKVFTFGSANKLKNLFFSIYRIASNGDFVTMLPPWPYKHIGFERRIGKFKWRDFFSSNNQHLPHYYRNNDK